MIYLSIRSTTAEAAKNRTIPPPPKTVNSQTTKNSTKHFNNLKFNNFYFRYYFKTFKTPSIPNPNSPKPFNSHNYKQKLNSQHQRSSEINFRRPLLIQTQSQTDNCQFNAAVRFPIQTYFLHRQTLG